MRTCKKFYWAGMFMGISNLALGCYVMQSPQFMKENLHLVALLGVGLIIMFALAFRGFYLEEHEI